MTVLVTYSVVLIHSKRFVSFFIYVKTFVHVVVNSDLGKLPEALELSSEQRVFLPLHLLKVHLD